jgi:lantibiotic modifying enzyme
METSLLAGPQTLSGVKAEVQTMVHRIYRHILAQPVGQDFSLLCGEAGIALFERYYQHHFRLPEADHTWQRMEACLEAIAEGAQSHTFARGIAGIAWGFLHLSNAGLLEGLESDAQSIVEDLDEPLFTAAMECLQEADFDYLHGGLGAIVYFLERDPSPKIHQYIRSLVIQLEKISVLSPHGGITWVFVDSDYKKLGNGTSYNLSLSHGTASIVAILALLYEKGFERERCHKLIHLALRWMWNVRNKQDISLFPNIVTDTLQDETSRLAWCYGDLGIANTFYLAGEKLGYKPWKDTALHAIFKSTSRRELADIYQKFTRVSTNPIFSSAARYWLTDTLQRALPETEDGVYLQSIRTKEGNTDYMSLGLLEGEAGIGMVLLSMLGAPTAWDRFLLLS